MNFVIKKSCLVAVFLLILAGAVRGQQPTISYDHPERPPSADELLEWHEVFTYEVRYSFFRLGKVKVEIASDTLYNQKKNWHLKAVITSNSNVPFVGKEENHYDAIFAPVEQTFQVQEYWSDNVDEDEYKVSRYIFDRKNKRVIGFEKGKPSDTLALEDPAISGVSVFYIGRLLAGTDATDTLNVYLNQNKKNLTINHTTQKQKRQYDAFPEEVETFYSKGTANVDGPFGFSGDFEAWYLTDDLRVPVESRLNVWLGKVKIKLVNYKKERRND